MRRGAALLCAVVLPMLVVGVAHAQEPGKPEPIAVADPVDPQLAAAVQKVLDAGFQPDRATKTELETYYRQAVKEIGSEHPWLDYAYALALTKNLHNDDAQPFLEAAATSTDPYTLPAREELIRQKIRKQQYSAALESLAELAEGVGKIPAQGRMGADAALSAGWIGTVLAYFEGAIGLEEVRREAQIIAVPIRGYLQQRYAAPFDHARTQVGITYHNLGRQLIESQRAAEEEKLALAAEAQQKQDQLRDQQQQIAEGAQELADVAKEDLSDVDSKIESLEKLLDASLKSEHAMILSETQLRAEIAGLRQQYTASRNAHRGGGGAFHYFVDPRDIEGQITIRELQLTTLQGEHILLLQTRDLLVRKGNALLGRRNQLAAHYGSRAGDIRQRMESLNRLQVQLEKATARETATPVDKLPEVTALRRRMKEFSTYDALGKRTSVHRLTLLTGATVPIDE